MPDVTDQGSGNAQAQYHAALLSELRSIGVKLDAVQVELHAVQVRLATGDADLIQLAKRVEKLEARQDRAVWLIVSAVVLGLLAMLFKGAAPLAAILGVIMGAL